MTVLEQQSRKKRKDKFLKNLPVAAAVGARLSSPSIKRQRRSMGQRTTATTTLSSTPLRERHRNVHVSSFSLIPTWMHINNNSNNNMWREQEQQQEEPMMQENRMELDMLTVRAIKSQVLNLLSDAGGGWCTMYDVCMALKVSQSIKKTLLMGGHSSESITVAEATTTSSDQQNVLGRGYFKMFAMAFSANHRKKQRQKYDASMHQMYRFMNALDAMQATPSTNEARISTWEDAMEELKTAFRFSPQALQDLQRQEQDDHYFDENNETSRNYDDYNHDNDQNYDIDATGAAVEKTTPYVEDLLDPMADFQKRSHVLQDKRTFAELKESTKRWLHVIAFKVPTQAIRSEDDNDAASGVVELDAADLAMKQRLQRQEEKTLQGRIPVGVRAAEARMQRQEEEEERELAEQARQAEARERAAALMRPFTDEENKQVQTALYNMGPEDEVIAQAGTDSVQRGSLQRLRPGLWLNDEVIHYFLIMLTRRDEEMCRNDPSRKRSHFFKSFFITKLLNEGHCDPAMDGKYQYSNVKRWSKKIPGKDIFNLDKIVFPINQDRAHWVCAVAFMQEKRIQFYDSMGADGMIYLKSIMQYIKDEHKDKNKTPLPDEDEWELIPCQPDTTPQQRNGFDCGVFTCMFADFVSKDCPLVFGQDHITLCRERIALSILKGTAIM